MKWKCKKLPQPYLHPVVLSRKSLFFQAVNYKKLRKKQVVVFFAKAQVLNNSDSLIAEYEHYRKIQQATN